MQNGSGSDYITIKILYLGLQKYIVLLLQLHGLFPIERVTKMPVRLISSIRFIINFWGWSLPSLRPQIYVYLTSVNLVKYAEVNEVSCRVDFQVSFHLNKLPNERLQVGSVFKGCILRNFKFTVMLISVSFMYCC